MCIAFKIMAKNISRDNPVLFGKGVSLPLQSPTLNCVSESADIGDSIQHNRRNCELFSSGHRQSARTVSVNIFVSKLDFMLRNQFLSFLLLLPATLLHFMSYILVYSHNPVLNPWETMARVTTAEDLSALHPSSQGIVFTPGPHSTQNRASVCGIRQRSIKSAAGLY